MDTNLNMAEIEATAKQVFAISKELQAEFGGDEAAYIALKRAEARGQTSIFKNGDKRNDGENSVVEIAVDPAAEFSGSPARVYSEERHCFLSGLALCATR